MMMRLAARASTVIRNGMRSSISVVKPPLPPSREAAALPVAVARQFSIDTSSFSFNLNPEPNPDPNPHALGMIKHGMALARKEKTEESYASGFLVLEQCESTQRDRNSRSMVELARSTLLYERGNYEEAIEKLTGIHDHTLCSVSARVDASEALIGIYLEHYREDAASAIADFALHILDMAKHDIGDTGGNEIMENRIKALKGLIELICGNLESAQSAFDGAQKDLVYSYSASLSYGVFLHGMRKFEAAKKLYESVMRAMAITLELGDPYNFGACNMNSQEVAIAAACGLGQLEAHLGNFSEAEETLTAALKQTEEHFGPQHPKVGVILTCLAFMYQLKAVKERSSSLIIQEGLYRKAIDLLKSPPLESDGVDGKIHRQDIIAFARGGYAETLIVQPSRKAEGEKMKKWAEKAWGNSWMSLGEALELSESSPRVPVVDSRIFRVV